MSLISCSIAIWTKHSRSRHRLRLHSPACLSRCLSCPRPRKLARRNRPPHVFSAGRERSRVDAPTLIAKIKRASKCLCRCMPPDLFCILTFTQTVNVLVATFIANTLRNLFADGASALAGRRRTTTMSMSLAHSLVSESVYRIIHFVLISIHPFITPSLKLTFTDTYILVY
jgi:hypothetical protein